MAIALKVTRSGVGSLSTSSKPSVAMLKLRLAQTKESAATARAKLVPGYATGTPFQRQVHERRIAAVNELAKRVETLTGQIEKAKLAGKSSADDRTPAKKPAIKPAATVRSAPEPYKLPHSPDGWWKIITNAKAPGGVWPFSWKYNDKAKLQTEIAALQSVGELADVVASGPPNGSWPSNNTNVLRIMGHK